MNNQIARLAEKALDNKKIDFLLRDLAKKPNFESLLQTGILFNRFFYVNNQTLLYNKLEVSERYGLLSYKKYSQNSTQTLEDMVALILWFRFCCWMISKVDEALFLSIDESDRKPFSALYAVAHCPIHFNRQVNAIAFDKAILQLPVHRTYEGIIDKKPALVKGLAYFSYGGMDSFVEARIIRLFESDSHAIRLSANEIASRLNMSESSLRRRLKERGSSFQRIRDHYRRDQAIAMLRIPQTSLIDIALKLGFSDASAFSRAFYRMTGLRPINYRARLTD